MNILVAKKSGTHASCNDVDGYTERNEEASLTIIVNLGAT